MSKTYTTTVWIERIIEVEVVVRVVPDTSATYWEPGCAGEAGIESFKVEHSDAESLTDEERAEAIEKASKKGPSDPGPHADYGATRPF